MNQPRYLLEVSADFMAFEFVSEGRNGKIPKAIRYTQTENPLIWNLGFGDLDSTSGEINDLAVSDNGDSKQVLATVAQSCLEFSSRFPEVLIYAEGSTPARTRLYQMGICQNYVAINELFRIWGLFKGQWQPFTLGKNYTAFLVKHR
jgi:hypothetical protein